MENNNRMVRPNIPIEWYQPRLTMFLIYLIYSAGFVIGFGYLSYSLAVSDIDLSYKIPLIALTTLLASNGFHLLGWFAHDGVHLSLAKNKYISMLLGTFVGSAVAFPTLGYGITHWTHHRYTNQKSDPDTQIYSKYTTFWRRFFMSRIVANRGYFKNTVALIFNRPLNGIYKMPFKDKEVRIFSIASIVFIAMWIGLYISIAIVNPLYALYAILLPYIVTIPITGLRIYLEHAGTKGGVFRDTRTYSSPFYTALLFGNNFHLEHHLYPKVPAYNLPLVHHYLKKNGYFEKWSSPVVEGVIAPLKYLSSDYQYPTAQIPDEKADPFDINGRSDTALNN